MKLNEIRDPSDYRSGDEFNPRSPDYIDPMDSIDVDSYRPDPAQWNVVPGTGKHQNDEYSFTIIGQCHADNEAAQYMYEYILPKFYDKFTDYELVWDEDVVKNGARIWTDYIQGTTPEANNPDLAKAMLSTLTQITEQLMDQIAQERAEADVQKNPPRRGRRR